MPVYEYACPECGPFEAMRPMAAFAEPCLCEGCGVPAQRAGLSAPRLAGMGAERRHAFATNERAANAPTRASHPSGCGCCKPAKAAGGAKSFPGARPWMIGH